MCRQKNAALKLDVIINTVVEEIAFLIKKSDANVCNVLEMVNQFQKQGIIMKNCIFASIILITSFAMRGSQKDIPGGHPAPVQHRTLGELLAELPQAQQIAALQAM